MPPMETTTVVLLVGAVVAGFVQGLSGFAFALTATCIWIWWLPPQLVAVMSVLGAFSGQLVAAVTVRRAAPWAQLWPRLWPILAGGLCGLPVGLWLVPRLDAEWFRLGVGLLLAVWCPLMLMSHRLPTISWGGRVADAVSGLSGGISGALGGYTGPLPTLWATLRGWPKAELRAVVQNFNLVMLGLTSASYVAAGWVTPQMWRQLAIVVPALLIPVLFGARLYAGISPEAFRRVVLSVLTCSGAALLWRTLPVLWQRF